MMQFQTKFIDGLIPYTGAELSAHYIYKNFNLCGDAAVAFCGPADVNLSEMVDLEDVAKKAPIYSESMLHFLIEHFNVSLPLMVARQRLLVCILFEELLKIIGNGKLRRQGDDLYDDDAKLSVSIASLSVVSGLIHTGINISSHNTPVKTKGLSDYGIEPPIFAALVLTRYQEEIQSMWKASCKVRGVL